MKKIHFQARSVTQNGSTANEKLATVKRMLKRGKSSLADIAEDTVLPLDTIKKVQAEMQAV